MSIITLDKDLCDRVLRRRAQKRQAGADAFYRLTNAIREKYLSENQAVELNGLIAARLPDSEELAEEENKFRGVLTRQPAHRYHGDCGGGDHLTADPFAIVDRVIGEHVKHGCEGCGSEEKISGEIQEANLAIGQFKVAARKGLIMPDQFFEVRQWLKACYGDCIKTTDKPAIRRSLMGTLHDLNKFREEHPRPKKDKGPKVYGPDSPIIRRSLMGTLHDLNEFREKHPRPKKDKGPKVYGPDSPIFPRLLAAIQSESFLPNQAKEISDKLLDKWDMKFPGLPEADRERMRDHAARRRLKKIEPGEVAILIALAEHELDYQQTQCVLRWLHALYEI